MFSWSPRPLGSGYVPKNLPQQTTVSCYKAAIAPAVVGDHTACNRPQTKLSLSEWKRKHYKRSKQRPQKPAWSARSLNGALAKHWRQLVCNFLLSTLRKQQRHTVHTKNSTCSCGRILFCRTIYRHSDVLKATRYEAKARHCNAKVKPKAPVRQKWVHSAYLSPRPVELQSAASYVASDTRLHTTFKPRAIVLHQQHVQMSLATLTLWAGDRNGIWTV